jgi:hypothetical protein
MNDGDFKKGVAQLNDIPKEVMKDAHKFYVKKTPIDTGNARRSTKYKANQHGATIHGSYPYAAKLDNGYSKQAPDGMTEPTIDYIENQLFKRMIRSWR